MIFTQRQLEALHGSNGSVTLPYRARLTPAAQDWVKAKKVAVGYADVNDDSSPKAVPLAATAPSGGAIAGANPGANAGAFLWWCDGPCGVAKAAISAVSKEANVAPMAILGDATKAVAAVKHLAAEVKNNRAAGGILVCQTSAAALVFANRCPSLRAVVGTSLEAVEAGIKTVAANVLIVEHPRLTLSQVKNLVSRFVKAPRVLSDEAQRDLLELASCG